MLRQTSTWKLIASIGSILIEVAFFWQLRLYSWWTRRSPRDILQETLANAQEFEEWEASAFQLDEELGFDLWRQNPTSKHYDYRLIYSRLQAIIEALDNDDLLTILSLLRSGLVRNLGNITAPALFNRAYAGTKLLIEDYVTHVALAVKYVSSYTSSPLDESGLTNQAKMDVLHDTRQAFGRTALVLQGGAVFGLCHMGVVKALYLRGLLPRIIVGTAAGGLIAALVGTHTEDELLEICNKISDSVLQSAKETNGLYPVPEDRVCTANLLDRLRNFIQQGFLLDVNALEQCVQDHVGDVTFQEAYDKTKRLLNITVSTIGSSGVPNLLNYLTAPNVLIRSAALASNASTPDTDVVLECRDETGNIVPWASAQGATFRPWTQASYTERESPLVRVTELFNVNHFIVSQARPYLAPFLRSDLHHPNPRQDYRWSLSLPILRLMVMEVQHRLHQLDSLGWLPPSTRRFLLDETIPGASLTLVPELSAQDLLKLLEQPTVESIKYWILKGERGVWPAVGAIKARCAVEIELERGYQVVRRRKPFDLETPGAMTRVADEEGRKRKRRAASFGNHL